jgi:hypothetical protein
MIKFALGLIVLLVGSVIFAVLRKARYGGPLIETDGEPHSLREMVERRRSEKQAGMSQ